MIEINRRQLLQVAQASLVLPVPFVKASQSDGGPEKATLTPLSVFLSVAPNGDVQIICHRSEMGQGVRTSLAQLIAEELEADWARVTVVQAEGDEKYGNQSTDGSTSIRRNFNRLRKVGAAARMMLERAAAETWNVPPSECKGRLHYVLHTPSRRRLGYGELAEKASKYTPPEVTDEQLKPRSEWRLIGRSVRSADLKAMVTGEARFGLDTEFPDMLHAVIVRPPQLFGELESFDRAAVMAVPGVVDLVEIAKPAPPPLFRPMGGIGILATNMPAALKAREVLAARWKDGPHAGHNSADHRQKLLAELDKPGIAMRRDGDAEAILAKAKRTISAKYVTPYLAHGAIETPCAVAKVTADGAEIWAPVQNPQNVRGNAAAILKMDPSKVRVNVTLVGGAFGRKAQHDFANEALLLAQKANGRPVKLLWTRTDDIQNAYYHATSCQRLDAAIGADKKVLAWRHRSAFTSIDSTFNPNNPKPQDWEMSQGALDVPFNIPNISAEAIAAQPPIRIGWLRSVANLFHAFATNSFVGELAHELKRDPKDLLIELLSPRRRLWPTTVGEAKYGNYDEDQDAHPINTARMIDVVETVAKMADWDRKRPKGVGLGIAHSRSLGSYVATVVEVDTRGKELVIPAIYVAMDAGTIVNPDTVVAQCEGGSIFGVSCALGEITVKNGIVEQSSLRDFEVVRMSNAPRRIEVRLLENNHAPGGVGEAPTPTVAPALCNAIFAATGNRIRQLPIKDQWRPKRS